MKTERHWLIEAIRARLLPEFARRGFEVVPLSGEDARGEIRAAFPFGRLRRAGPGGYQLVEIQLHNRRRAALRLNVGIAPPGGIDHFTGTHIVQEDIWVTYLDQYYEVYKCPAFRGWFHVWHWPGRAVTESNYQDLVAGILGLIPEVEAVLREGKPGPHIKRVGLRRRAART